MKQGTLALLFAGMIVTMSCSSGPASDYEGTATLKRENDGLNTPPISSTSARLSFSGSRIRLSSAAPVPDCTIEASLQEGESYFLSGSTAYRGDSNDGSGCRALLSPAAGTAASIDIFDGAMTIKDGSARVKLRFTGRGSSYPVYEMEFTGRKAGWF
jgi:hypothetical protein